MTEAETAVREALAKMPEADWECQPTQTEGLDAGVYIVAGNLGGLIAAVLPQPTEADAGDFARVEALAAGIVALKNHTPALLAELDAARAEVARLRAAIDRQAAAIRTLHANEETEINRLRRKQQEWHQAVATLDSERQANAMLTAEVERLREALEYVAEHCDRCGGAGAILAHDHVTAKDLWEDCTLCAPARAALEPRP